MNPNHPHSDDFQGRPRWREGPERQYGAGRMTGESRQRGQEEPWQMQHDPWGREEYARPADQSWGRGQWGEPARGSRWGTDEQSVWRDRYPQDYQEGGRLRYGQSDGNLYGQQYARSDRSWQPGRSPYDDPYIGAYPSNASAEYRSSRDWRQPQQRWQQGQDWEEPYWQSGETWGQSPYGQPYGQSSGQSAWTRGNGREGGAEHQRLQSFRGLGPKGYVRSDDRIREDICERLSQDPYVDASDISVECRGGVVMLEGTVGDRATKHRVEDLVDGCSGVKDILNHLNVAMAGRQTQDAEQQGMEKSAAASGSTRKQ